MKKYSRPFTHIASFIFLWLCMVKSFAQGYSTTNTSDDPQDLLRSNGLIYVVIGVIVIILCGLIVYLTSIDKKVGRLEKEIREK